jgi:hypothetical protein
MALSSIAMNYRMRANGERTPAQMQASMQRQLRGREEENSIPIPLSEFNESEIRMHLNFTMPATLSHYGLRIKSQAPNFDALSLFLGRRCNYWTDDIEHQDPFEQVHQES